MALITLLAKSIIGELGGLRYALVLGLMLSTVVPLLSLYSTVVALGEYIPPAPLLYAEVYRVSMVLGGSSVEGYLYCFRTPDEVVVAEGVRLAWLKSEGVVLPRAYEVVASAGDIVEAILPDSSRVQVYVLGFYGEDVDRFIMVSSSCPEPSVVDGNRVIFGSLVKEVGGLVATAVAYIHFVATLTVWLQMKRRSEALRRTLFTLKIAGTRVYNRLAFAVSLTIALTIISIAVSLGVTITQIVVNMLAWLLDATILTPFIEPPVLAYTFTLLLATMLFTLYIGLLVAGRGVRDDRGGYENA